MIKIENHEVSGFEAAIRGLRNPMNSWDMSDSFQGCEMNSCDKCDDCDYHECHESMSKYIIGENDLALMKKLVNAGSDHRKFMRFITVTVDVTAPLYWWKEYDTYKVGTVANSCSTMHKIHAKEFTLDDFSCEHLLGENCVPDHDYQSSRYVLDLVIESLNFWRNEYLTGEESGIAKNKEAWWQMIQLLPTSYNQKRTLLLNYEVLRNIYHARKNHKLDEWHDFCAWVELLPYSELITM